LTILLRKDRLDLVGGLVTYIQPLYPVTSYDACFNCHMFVGD